MRRVRDPGAFSGGMAPVLRRAAECEVCTPEVLLESIATAMSLEYVDWDDGDVAVITLIGRITLGQGTERLREAIKEVMTRGRTKVLLNFDEVLYMDSTGLGELVDARRRVIAAGGQLKLMKLQQVARNLMQITQLYTVFEIYKDEATALASFRTPPRN